MSATPCERSAEAHPSRRLAADARDRHRCEHLRFRVSRAVLLQPLPYADAERVYRITSSWPGHPTDQVPLSPADFADLQKAQTSFTDLAAIVPSGPVIWRPESGDPKSLDALLVGSNIFGVLGTPALHGRAFMPGDEVPGNDLKVVLSFGTWQRDFGGDARVVGRTIQLSGRSYEVIGVMPRGFLVGQSEELWLPYDQAGTLSDVVRARKQHYVNAVGRLRSGIASARALGDLRTIAARLAQQYPEADSARSANMRPVRDIITGNIRPALLLLQGAAALVLLIACANLANLALSRTMGRRRELATRAALGAGRARLVRQLVTESVVLSVVGGAMGVGLAMVGTRLLLSLNPTTLPSMFDARVDRGVLAFSVAVSMVTGVLFGLLPALDASSGNLHESLKDGGRGTSGGRASGRVRRGLVVAQVALALMLLTGAGLLVRSFGELARVTLGYDPTGVVTAGLRTAGDQYGDPARVNAFYDGVIDELSRSPGVTAVAAVSDLPTHGGSGTALRIEGEHNDEARLPDLTYLSVHGDFFKAMRVPIIAGRAYDASDRARHTRDHDHQRDRGETVLPERRRSWAPDRHWARPEGRVDDRHRCGRRHPLDGARRTRHADHLREPSPRSVDAVDVARHADVAPRHRGRHVDPTRDSRTGSVARRSRRRDAQRHRRRESRVAPVRTWPRDELRVHRADTRRRRHLRRTRVQRRQPHPRVRRSHRARCIVAPRGVVSRPSGCRDLDRGDPRRPYRRDARRATVAWNAVRGHTAGRGHVRGGGGAAVHRRGCRLPGAGPARDTGGPAHEHASGLNVMSAIDPSVSQC